ncbi:hypothetical protein HWV62_27105 [Athelia sp. TMB]|nr:hypothetical protein HWV62_27105 [Athelia sp. TMB]
MAAVQSDQQEHKKKLAECYKRIDALRKKCARTPRALAKAIKRAEEKGQIDAGLHLARRIESKGVYTAEARALMRELAKAGCAPSKTGKVIEMVAQLGGANYTSKLSRRTVRRAIIEGGVAAKMQLGYEIKMAKGMLISGWLHLSFRPSNPLNLLAVTMSSDATTHRHKNKEARHIALSAPSYEAGSDQSILTHQNRLVGVHDSISHSSEQQFEDWKAKLTDIADTFNDSPFAKRTGLKLNVAEFVEKLKGLNGDHAADVIKSAELWIAFKKAININKLGIQVLSMHSPDDLLIFLAEENAKKIESVGGQANWEVLPAKEQDAIDEVFVAQMLERLGTAAHADLPEDVRRAMDFFVRAGCCMHKDLNSVKGGTKAMMAWYAQSGATAPVLLANRDNDVTIKHIASATALTAAEEHALEATTRGGIKATTLAGAMFNHKDDKKGQQDTYKQYFELRLGYPVTFPDTSNTRYGSHCDAAAALLTHLPLYIEFLEHVRDRKEKQGFNHLENNLYKALLDPPTLSELAVLALYAQSVTHPYMKQVRGPGTENVNILDLGPLHVQVLEHVAKIAENPQILLVAEHSSYIEGALDGREWHQRDIITAILALKDKLALPHLEILIGEFFRGALDTWKRFTSEYAPGGLIDTSTIEERDLAWMPSTNDANEGALGSFRVYMRHKPGTAMHVYTAQATFHRNKTQSFMDFHLTDEDNRYIMAKAREIDASGVEKAQREADTKHQAKLVAEKRAKTAARVQKKQDKSERLARVHLILDFEVLKGLKNSDLKDQLELHRKVPGNSIASRTSLSTKEPMLIALKALVSSYQNHQVSDAQPIDYLRGGTLDQTVDLVEGRWQSEYGSEAE